MATAHMFVPTSTMMLEQGDCCAEWGQIQTLGKSAHRKRCRVYIQNTEADQKSRKAKDQAAVQDTVLDTTSDVVVSSGDLYRLKAPIHFNLF